MNFATQTKLLFRRKMLEMIRQPVWIFAGLASPLLYLALFAPLLGALAGGPGFAKSSVLDVFVPGIIVLMAFGAGMGAGWITIAELDSGVLERLTVTPASRFALLLGTVLRDMVWLVIPALLVIVVAIPFGFHPNPAGTTVLLVLASLLTAMTSAVSSALGIKLRQIGSLAAVVTGLQLPLMLLSGILLPLSLAPTWLVVLAHIDPMYYAVEASRALAAGSILSGTVGLAFLVLGALTLLSLWWATGVYRRALA
jgi:ABC-2 type transport system permease protein